MISIHVQQTLFDDTGYQSNTLRYTAPGVATDVITAQTYDEVADIVSALDTESSLTWGLNTSTGKVSISSGGLFIPKYYDSTSATDAAKYNTLWGLLGFDTSDQPAGPGILFTADNYPAYSIWLDVLNEISEDGRQTIVHQATGLQGHIKQVGIANFTTKSIAHGFIDDTQRQAVEAWYGLASQGAKITINNGVSQIGQYYLDESMLGGVGSVLERRTLKKRFWKLTLQLRSA